MKQNTEMAFMLTMFLSLIGPFFIGYIFVTYIKSLENKKCACSNDRRRKYVKYYGYFLILFSLITLIFNIIFGLISNKYFQNIIRIVSFTINILAAYLIYSYSNILEESTCKCSISWKKTFLKFYGYLLGGIFSLISLCLIIMFIYHISQGDDIIIKQIKA
tara:strand:+ start:7165 stop:7647 length:483 start_codon:yes stop_codon:yes gene_type:complete